MVEREDERTRRFREIQDQTLKSDTAPETKTSGTRPILKNKTAVQAEEIWRTVDLHTVITKADEDEYDRKLKSLTEWNEYSIITEEDDSQQNTSTDKGNRNRKGVAINEEANTVRGIPKDNNGKIRTKRYSTEQSWLDRYMEIKADEEFQEEFYGNLNAELDMIQQLEAELRNMERNYRPFQDSAIRGRIQEA